MLLNLHFFDQKNSAVGGFTKNENPANSGPTWRVVRLVVRPVKFAFKIDVSNALELVHRQIPNAVPYVKASFLTGLAKAVQGKVTAQIPVAFDRPTPFTQRSAWVKPATKATPTADVYFPQSPAGSGKGLREYIRPGAEGASARRQKKTEYLLSAMGLLPAGWVSVPGSYGMKHLDGFGNMPGSYYKELIRGLRIKGTRGPPKPVSAASGRRAARMGVQYEFFAVSPGANSLGRNGGYLPSGVYKRAGRGGRDLLQYLKFVKKASYRPRLNMVKIAQAEVAASANAEFSKAWSSVIHRFAAKAGVTR